MRAIGIYKHTSVDQADSFIEEQVDKPTAAGEDVLVKVKAVSVNPVDTKQRKLKEDDGNFRILGFDAAGIIEEVGENVEGFQPGDEVYYAGSVARQGSNSEFQLVDYKVIAKKPANLSFAEAAALPLTALTAWEAMFEKMHIPLDEEANKDKTILLVNAAGGVGSIASQFAQLYGLNVVGTASREETITWAKQHGTERVINHHEPFHPQLEKLGIDSVDYVFCMHQLDKAWDDIIEVVKPEGIICAITGPVEDIKLTDLTSKSLTLVWEYMFTRTLHQTPSRYKQGEILSKVAELIEDERIRTTKAEELEGLTVENVQKAHKRLEDGNMIGKLVISV
ncbi:NADPH:quinone reductase [Terribacillus saccharophilus]|uniref:zinc-binding alcohol dehydrogenase family protein n=1 Tax=Terribacillus saccharophilus TaxID=361277 RepID=UPI000BA7BE3C|nr:zinc-binding alcohol dehydrogenase family protein [Terribacillus saccharophilus]PAF18204.1 NADPH:quinone reductase [Terribacillus saccharophilus]PAF23634.1 NADPH:quinone reductase [Terribacillus saccharophilus]PAF37311.1 NADPH:quinone reductase [Terribacillus saccharophilus]